MDSTLHRKMRSLTLSIALILFVMPGAAQPDKLHFEDKYIPNIETFMKVGYATSPGISDETGEIFFVSAMSGVNQLYRLTEEGWPYQLTVFDDGIDWYSLSYDGRLAIAGAALGGSEDHQLFLIDTRTGRTRQLTFTPRTRYGTLFWKKDGGSFYFAANLESPKDFEIFRYDFATAGITKILDRDGSNWISDMSLDEKYLIIFHERSNVSNDLLLLELRTGEDRVITPDRENIRYSSPKLMPDNNTVYLLCNDNEEGILKRARLDAGSRELEFIDPDSRWNIDGLCFSDNRRYMGWLVNEEGYSNLRLYDIQKNRPIPGPPITGNILYAVPTNDGRVLFRFFTATRAPDVWLWDWKAPELKKVTHSIYAGIDPDVFVEPELIRYKSFDGLEIPAFMFLPPDYNGEPVPFIVHVHGGPEEQFRPRFQRHFNYLLLNGYGIITPNVRGSSGYGRRYLNMDNYKKRMDAIKDIKAGVDYLIENGYTRKGMIGIKGKSYGGFAVLACITEYPELFSAAVEMSGIANFVTFLQNTRDYRRELRETEYGPLTDEDFLKSISPIHKADRIKTPLLVVHGQNDPRVPIGEARQIISAIQDNGGTVDSLIFSDEGHQIRKLTNRLVYYSKMVEFFDKNLK
ncbi:MAG: S9 family peptidase [Candidatus Zixiibacteriota bacterium]|nr:MAG: S9 family peptidase [candidate division Zixibacteria bacterium]